VSLAVDTSALAAIFKGEPDASQWMDLLVQLSATSPLIATDIVWAELAPLFPNLPTLQARMDDLGISYDPVREEAAFLAGQSFLAYRRAGGPRDHLIPDFLIAAHAQHQAYGLIAADRGYIRKYFRRLRVHCI
jgi:predicted nucleic acid-binding protein